MEQTGEMLHFVLVNCAEMVVLRLSSILEIYYCEHKNATSNSMIKVQLSFSHYLKY